MRNIINSILSNYENIYLYKDVVTEKELLALFKGKQNARNMLNAFMTSGLSPNKITPKVQAAILKLNHDNSIMFDRGDEADRMLKAFIKYNIQMSDETLKYFVITNKCMLSEINYPRNILHYGIMNYKNTTYAGYPIWILQRIIKYMTDKKIKFTEEEKLYIWQNYFSEKNFEQMLADEGYYYTEWLETFKEFIKQNMPFSSNIIEHGIANNRNALRFLIRNQKGFIANIPVMLGTPELQKLAIQTYPELEMLNCLPKTTDNQLTYLSLRPTMRDIKDFLMVVYNVASDVVRKYILLLDNALNNRIVPSNFQGLTNQSTLLSTLIHTKFDRLTWYKVMETILSQNKGLSDEVLKEMIKQNPEVDVLIYKYYPEFFVKKRSNKPMEKHTVTSFLEHLFNVKQKKQHKANEQNTNTL